MYFLEKSKMAAKMANIGNLGLIQARRRGRGGGGVRGIRTSPPQTQDIDKMK